MPITKRIQGRSTYPSKRITPRPKNEVQRLQRHKVALAVVDVQERLLPSIWEQERLVQNTVRLIQGLTILKRPIFVTEQYPKGLGRTVPQISQALGGISPMEKVVFSACGAAGFAQALKKAKIADVVLCGIEAHVCVLQTCLDLIESGFAVFVVADAVSSRTEQNYLIALERMQNAGAVIASTEMVLFELLGKAGTAEFRQILPVVK